MNQTRDESEPSTAVILKTKSKFKEPFRTPMINR